MRHATIHCDVDEPVDDSPTYTYAPLEIEAAWDGDLSTDANECAS